MYKQMQFTGHTLQDNVLLLLTTCGKADRQSISILHPSKGYLYKTLLEMKYAQLISISSDKPSIIALTQHGVSFIQNINPKAYAHYIKITNNQNPGWTSKHITNSIKASDICAQMIAAGINIGPQKGHPQGCPSLLILNSVYTSIK